MCVYIPKRSVAKLDRIMLSYCGGDKPSAGERLRNLQKKELAWLLLGQPDLPNGLSGRELVTFNIWASGVLSA